jgi:hypothetical protein
MFYYKMYMLQDAIARNKIARLMWLEPEELEGLRNSSVPAGCHACTPHVCGMFLGEDKLFLDFSIHCFTLGSNLLLLLNVRG